MSVTCNRRNVFFCSMIDASMASRSYSEPHIRHSHRAPLRELCCSSGSGSRSSSRHKSMLRMLLHVLQMTISSLRGFRKTASSENSFTDIRLRRFHFKSPISILNSWEQLSTAATELMNSSEGWSVIWRCEWVFSSKQTSKYSDQIMRRCVECLSGSQQDNEFYQTH